MTRLAPHYPLGDDQKLFWIDGFLRPEQCAAMLDELDFALWRPSTVAERYDGAELSVVRRSMRVSESTAEEWFTPALRRMIRAIDARIARLVPRLAARRERWQATRYVRGGRFDYHFDCGHWADEPAGERERTVLLYLDTPRRGGSTHFRELDVDVEARAGRLVVWRNLTPARARDPDMLHAGAPLAAGRKTVLVTWVRQRTLRTGG
ncbi:MAG TPA: 2OG-Fe(II) oxygenase [Gemmatimonadaceae bacterium]|nr:2OG-Fe(II) oxygenase [Gemmatimonadaceae bacterium]